MRCPPRIVLCLSSLAWPFTAAAGAAVYDLGETPPFASALLVAKPWVMRRCAATFARQMARAWQDIVERIPESTQALIVTHGGIPEMGAVAAVSDEPHEDWGDAIGYCEGVRLTFDDRFTGCEVLRVPEEYRLIEN